MNRASEWKRDKYTISTDNKRLNLELIHQFLSKQSYWAQGRAVETVRCALQNSLNFGLYQDARQIGFARVVTDYCTFAWLADVFVIEDCRGQGLSKWLVEVIMNHDQLKGVKRWVLATRDAHGLYQRFGFSEMRQPERWMERFRENESLNGD